MHLTGTGIYCPALRWGDEAQLAEAAAEAEALGYTSLWIPDIGGDVFAAVERLLAATGSTIVGTGILNVWMHTAEEATTGYADMTHRYGDRLLIGIGVSHGPIVDSRLGDGQYTRPLATMRAFLDAVDSAPAPIPPERRILAALGPKMTQLAAERTSGVIPYNVIPDQTANARAVLGPSKLVVTEQLVALTTDPGTARDLGRRFLHHYLEMPNYVNSFRRFGMTDDDFAGDGSDRLVDAILAWGDDDTIVRRVREHREAGADHVCVQVVSDRSTLPRETWRALAPALTTL